MDDLINQNPLLIHIYTQSKSLSPVPITDGISESIGCTFYCECLQKQRHSPSHECHNSDHQTNAEPTFNPSEEALYDYLIQVLSLVINHSKSAHGGRFAVVIFCACSMQHRVAMAQWVVKWLRESDFPKMSIKISHLDVNGSKNSRQTGRISKKPLVTRYAHRRPAEMTFTQSDADENEELRQWREAYLQAREDAIEQKRSLIKLQEKYLYRELHTIQAELTAIKAKEELAKSKRTIKSEKSFIRANLKLITFVSAILLAVLLFFAWLFDIGRKEDKCLIDLKGERSERLL